MCVCAQIYILEFLCVCMFPCTKSGIIMESCTSVSCCMIIKRTPLPASIHSPQTATVPPPGLRQRHSSELQ